MFKLLKRFFFDAGMDVTIFSLMSMSKSALSSLVKMFLNKTGNVITDEAVKEIVDLLPSSEQDEKMIDDAMIYIETVLNKKTVRKAWSDHMENIGNLSPDHNECEKLKEYYRRLTIKETVEKTAQKILTDTHMSPKDFEAYINALSIKRKVLEPKYKGFIDFVKQGGRDLIAKAKMQRNDIGSSIDDITGKLEAYNNAQDAKLKKWEKWF